MNSSPLFGSLRLAVAVVSTAVLLGCPAPTPPRDIAAVERCDDLPLDPALGALYTGHITRVDPVEAPAPDRGAGAVRLEGAAIRLHDVRADDALLARALACHAAYADVPAVSSVAPRIDPLRAHGAEVRIGVERTDGEIVVRVTARNEVVASDILHRASVLADRARDRARRTASER